MWRVILVGRSKHDGIDTATVFCKTSRNANRSGDIRGSANRGYSASQKRYHGRNKYLRPTVRPSFAPFLSFVYALLGVRAPHGGGILSLRSDEGFAGYFFDGLIFGSYISLHKV